MIRIGAGMIFDKFFKKKETFRISNCEQLTVKSEPTVTVDGILKIGNCEAPYKTIYDLTNIPGEWHYLFIHAIQRR